VQKNAYFYILLKEDAIIDEFSMIFLVHRILLMEESFKSNMP
jgi:hypothetical protein